MSRQGWVEALTDAPLAAGTLFNTYTTAKTVLPSGQVIPVKPGFWQPGKRMRFTVLGVESHRVTGPDTMTFQINMTAVAAASSGAVNLTTTSHVLVPFIAQCWCKCEVGGTAAQLRSQWIISGQGFAGAASLADNVANTGQVMAPNTTPALGTAFDATVAQNIDLFVAQSVSNVLNGIQIYDWIAEDLN